MRRWLAAALCLSIAAGAAHAATPLTPTDFAYGVQLQVDGGGAMYAVPLPQQVYQGVTRADLGDMRVFNAQGTPVAHLIRSAVAQSQAQAPVSLPFFPLYGGAAKRSDLAVKIKTDDKGTIIDVAGPKSAATSVLHAYIIDASALHSAPAKLTVQWTPVQQSFVAHVRIDYSNDLTHWRPLVASATLAELSYSGHRLGQYDIELPRTAARYLRLDWPAGVGGVRISALQAGFARSVVQPQRRWSTFAVSRGETPRPGSRVFDIDTHGFLPVDRVRVKLAQRNMLLQVRLFSRGATAQPWRERYRGVLYQLQVDATTLRRTDIDVPTVRDRYWRLEVDDGASETDISQLSLGWLTQDLVFVAQGEGPFELAYGSGRIGPSDAPLQRLLADLDHDHAQRLVKPARLGRFVTLGGAQRLQPPPVPRPWKQWLLWAVLVLGVLVAGAMAWRLYRQMGAV